MPASRRCFWRGARDAVFTSKWWTSGTAAIGRQRNSFDSFCGDPQCRVIYLQVILGAGFRHKDIPIWPHMAGALLVWEW